MRPLDLEEFAADLYRNGNEFGKEILELIDSEPEAEDNRNAIADIEKLAPDNIRLSDDRWRLVEWVTDRSQLLDEIADTLDKAGYQGDIDDALRDALYDLETTKDLLEIAEAELESLKNPPMVYDL